MNRFLLFSLIITTFSFCGSKNEKAKNSFSVLGKLIHNTEKNIFLNELTTKGLRLIDSSTVNADGTFSFKGNVTEKTFCIISFPKGATVIVPNTAGRGKSNECQQIHRTSTFRDRLACR